MLLFAEHCTVWSRLAISFRSCFFSFNFHAFTRRREWKKNAPAHCQHWSQIHGAYRIDDAKYCFPSKKYYVVWRIRCLNIDCGNLFELLALREFNCHVREKSLRAIKTFSKVSHFNCKCSILTRIVVNVSGNCSAFSGHNQCEIVSVIQICEQQQNTWSESILLYFPVNMWLGFFLSRCLCAHFS